MGAGRGVGIAKGTGSEWMWRKRWVCIEMTLCKGLAVKGRLKIGKYLGGSRVEGRLFIGVGDLGIPGVRKREKARRRQGECIGRGRPITGGRSWMSLDVCSVPCELQLRASGVLGKHSLPFSEIPSLSLKGWISWSARGSALVHRKMLLA